MQRSGLQQEDSGCRGPACRRMAEWAGERWKHYEESEDEEDDWERQNDQPFNLGA
jgi:hypothetical protein